MIQKLVFNILLLLTTFAYAQNKSKVNIFLDENLKPINRISFYEKRNSFIYFSKSYENDTLVVQQIYERIKFGSLDSIENSQIRQRIMKESGNSHISDKTLIITFRDTLMSYESYKNRWYMATITESAFNTIIKEYDQNQKKCIKRDLKNDYLRLYFYNFNKDYKYQPKNFEWKQSSSIINAFLFKNHSTMLILKPNGSYFYFVEVYEKLVKELLETEDWTPFVLDFEKAKANLTQKPFGNLTSINLPEYLRQNTGSIDYSLHCYYKGDY